MAAARPLVVLLAVGVAVLAVAPAADARPDPFIVCVTEPCGPCVQLHGECVRVPDCVPGDLECDWP